MQKVQICAKPGDSSNFERNFNSLLLFYLLTFSWRSLANSEWSLLKIDQVTLKPSRFLIFMSTPKDCFVCINFWGKSKYVQNHKILYTWKFSTARYDSWSPWIEKLHIIDNLAVQHQILDQTKAWGEIWDSWKKFWKKF